MADLQTDLDVLQQTLTNVTNMAVDLVQSAMNTYSNLIETIPSAEVFIEEHPWPLASSGVNGMLLADGEYVDTSGMSTVSYQQQALVSSIM